MGDNTVSACSLQPKLEQNHQISHYKNIGFILLIAIGKGLN